LPVPEAYDFLPAPARSVVFQILPAFHSLLSLSFRLITPGGGVDIKKIGVRLSYAALISPESPLPAYLYTIDE
jgi:hypothetical protein